VVWRAEGERAAKTSKACFLKNLTPIAVAKVKAFMAGCAPSAAGFAAGFAAGLAF